MRVFVTGGTGLVGSRLTARLCERSDSPVVLSRDAPAALAKLGTGVEIVEGDPATGGEWEQAIQTCDAVVNLAGENIFAHRWNEETKARIRDSRVQSTRRIVAAVGRATNRPRVLVKASAVGYYGFHDDEELTEADGPGEDFLARSCVEWEAAARELVPTGVRLVIVRIGVVLSTAGGALMQMLTPFKLGVGGPVGNGRQWMSWVHIDDLIGIILHALDHEHVSGVINGTAPEPVTNQQFSKALGRALGRPSFFRVPGFMLRLQFGQVAEIITSGQRVLPKRTVELGYQFRYPTIDAALVDLLAP
ncbi:MAG: TIGR01777 family protein [Planctomycetes bacterium]|nr:TIGR01777 family protein [Planctomycetota bacterium]